MADIEYVQSVLSQYASACMERRDGHAQRAARLVNAAEAMDDAGIPSVPGLLRRMASWQEKRALWWSIRGDVFLWLRDGHESKHGWDIEAIDPKAIADALGVQK